MRHMDFLYGRPVRHMDFLYGRPVRHMDFLYGRLLRHMQTAVRPVTECRYARTAAAVDRGVRALAELVDGFYGDGATAYGARRAYGFPVWGAFTTYANHYASRDRSLAHSMALPYGRPVRPMQLPMCRATTCIRIWLFRWGQANTPYASRDRVHAHMAFPFDTISCEPQCVTRPSIYAYGFPYGPPHATYANPQCVTRPRPGTC